MDIGKIYVYQGLLQREFTFEEISKLYREILYTIYEGLEDSDSIHCYQLLRGLIDIFTQMTQGRKFEEGYLKDTIKW